MADTPLIEQLNSFVREQWERTLNYLQGTFHIPRMDCEDIFQDAFIVLHQHVKDGKLDNLQASLSTYFFGICRNKAHEWLRRKGMELDIIDEFPETTKSEFEDERSDSLLALEDEDEKIEERKSAIVREIVDNMPEPCNNILWGFYRDGFSMKTMAEMFNYKSEGSVKVTKHRCCDKFKDKYKEITKRLSNVD